MFKSSKFSAIIRVVAGAYLAYLGYQMIKNVKTGDLGKMSPTVANICAAAFIVIGAVFVVTGIISLMRKSPEDEQEAIEENETEESTEGENKEYLEGEDEEYEYEEVEEEVVDEAESEEETDEETDDEAALEEEADQEEAEEPAEESDKED